MPHNVSNLSIIFRFGKFLAFYWLAVRGIPSYLMDWCKGQFISFYLVSWTFPRRLLNRKAWGRIVFVRLVSMLVVLFVRLAPERLASDKLASEALYLS